MDKKALREAMIKKRKEITQDEKAKKSNAIKEKLFETEHYKNADFIFTFISTDEEIDTHNIIRESLKKGKRIGVPITLPKERKLVVSEIKDFDNELEMGFYGILSPKKEYIREISPNEVDVVLVPGLIFREDGFRIGYGGGYYDRFLRDAKSAVKIGLCYEIQIDEDIPIEMHDIPVDYIITEKRIIDCKNNRKQG